MNQYHKIQTIFKRDPDTKFKTLIIGDYSLPEFEYLKNNVWVFTEKVDGTNIRIMWDGKDITFGGKTDNAQIPAFLVKKLQDTFLPQIDKFKEKFGEEGNVCLYGEGYGAKIQGIGGNYRSDQDFVLFDIKIKDWWLNREDVEDISDFLEIGIVPIISQGTLDNMINIVSLGFNSRWGAFLAEGLVARPKIELKTRSGQRIITKLKYKDFPK